ncbi:MAG: polysaccharide pyruvyl transferase family protein [Cruoricaptor ignavus]|nr:polysaccharide pyruvyl transferase family protein [Cruoricaptor ignavus]
MFKSRLEKVLFIKKLKNLPKEIFGGKYILVTSSIDPFFKNWGDDISTVIAQLINPSVRIIPSKYSFNIFRKKEFLSVGSIITWLTKPNTIIWGSGVQFPEDNIIYKGKEIKPLKVLAVRGPLTRDYLLKKNIDCPEIYGDPALLFPKYYKPNVEKKYKLGIIPHFKDKNSKVVKQILEDENIHFIDIQNVTDWRTFINEVASCEAVLSSSLHGIIVCDSYNVPNAWVEFDRKNLKRFTFNDYFMSVNKGMQEPKNLPETPTLEQLIKLTEDWKAPEIDLSPLLSVCPFIKNTK